jgi:hypothetical protein
MSNNIPQVGDVFEVIARHNVNGSIEYEYIFYVGIDDAFGVERVKLMRFKISKDSLVFGEVEKDDYAADSYIQGTNDVPFVKKVTREKTINLITKLARIHLI